MKKIAISIWIILQATLAISQPDQSKSPEFILVKADSVPVITTKSKGAEDNKYGFESGTAVKVGDTYHIFISEIIDDPFWVRMRSGHWTSKDRANWVRVATIFESSGDFTGSDPRASLWTPTVVWDEDEGLWNLFYVAYYSEPNTNNQFKLNHSGRIYRAKSKSKGIEGINGPYADLGIIMQPGKDSGPWEGLQGVDSFYPWKVDDTWFAFYGSAKTENTKMKQRVGFAKSKKMDGPWQRLSYISPSKIEERFIENPIVTKLPEGGWVCIYDCNTRDAIGWAYSSDGINWGKGQSLIIQNASGIWAKDVRTPIGLIHEGGNRFTLFYTGFETLYDWPGIMKNKIPDGVTCAIGVAELELRQ